MKESLEAYIHNHALATPDKVAVVCDDKETTYAELWNMIQEKAIELQRQGLKAGDIYVIRASQSLEYLVLYFAVHLVKAVICPLEKDITDQRFNQILNDVKDIKFDPETDSDVLYTTGTTGSSKGVLISKKAILSNGENLIDSLHFTNDLTFVITGPINHSGNWSKVFPTIIIGATLYIIEGMKDLNVFFKAMNRHGSKTACFLVPASIRMLLMLGRKPLEELKDKIEFIETGGAPISSSDMKALSEALPNTRLYNTYASSECGMIATYNFNDGLYKNSCCGHAMKHASFEIIEDKIVCRNDGMMTRYINAPELTQEVLRDGKVFTNDLGHIDQEGMLIIEGRNNDVINVGGLKVSPTEVEDITLSYPGVKDCICLPKPHPMMGNVVRLLIVVEDTETFDRRKLAKYIAEHLEKYKIPQSIDFAQSINRTYNGKLDRKSYMNQNK